MSRLRLGLLAVALVAGLAIWFTASPSAAQKDGPPLKGYLPANWKKLGLSSDQVQQVYRIQAAYDAKTDALKKQLDDLKQQEKEELHKVLTPAQKERLKEILLGTLPKDPAPKDKDAPKDTPKDSQKEG